VISLATDRHFINACHAGSYAAARRENACHFAAHRPASRDEIIQYSIDGRFVINSLIAEILQIELQRFQLDALFSGCINVRYGAKVRLPGLRADDLDGIIPSDSWIGKSLKLIGGRRCTSGHVWPREVQIVPVVIITPSAFVFQFANSICRVEHPTSLS
jgi:hypothetical protein